MKKCEVIQPIETVTSWEVKCPYCKKDTFPLIDEDADWDTGVCEHCNKTFIVNLKEWSKKVQNEIRLQ